jgi:cAMP phosphodiesterase
LLADLVVGMREKPITIHGSVECVKALQDNMFNDRLWPDFTQIPSKKNPVLRFKSFKAGSKFAIGKYKIQSVPVSHPVESCGFIVSDGDTAVAMSGDTGPTEKLWEAVNKTPNLKAVLLETSFPNRLQQLADISGHLTPHTLRGELAKFDRNGAAVFLYHLKPAFVAQVKKELGDLPVSVLELGDRFEF